MSLLASPLSSLLVHPGAVQLAVELLLIAPLFIFLSAVLPPLKSRPFTIVALILMGLGTLGLWLAAPADPVAADALTVDVSGTDNAAALAQQKLAAETRIVFAGLLILYVGVILIPYVVHRPDSRLLCTALPLAFLLLYSAGGVFLINIASQAESALHPVATSVLASSSPDTGMIGMN